jgi:DNA mismatch repair protein MutS
VTPLLEQWARLKAEAGTAWLFFRLGDFYELFFDDAVEAAAVLDVQLTSRDGTTPMCGVPYHALDVYLARALAAGRSVAVAEQLEDPREARGLVERGIVRRVTPGTFVPEQGESPGPLAALVTHAGGFGLAVVYMGEGRAEATEYRGSDWREVLAAEWARWGPAECVLPEGEPPAPAAAVRRPEYFQSRTARGYLLDRLGTVSLTGVGLESWPWAQEALAAALRYADSLHPGGLRHLTRVSAVAPQDALLLSAGAARQLGVEGPDALDLMSWLSRAVTPMGRRTLRHWILRPLKDTAVIDARHEAVERWAARPREREQLRDRVRHIGDVERWVARLSLGVGAPRDLVRLGQALAMRDPIRDLVRAVVDDDPDLNLPDLAALSAQLAALDPEAGNRWDEGGLVRPGADPELDRLRNATETLRARLLDLEQQLRRETGMRSLKVGVHRTLGHYIEVSRREAEAVPAGWRQKQSMAATVRYTTAELDELADRIAAAESAWMEAEAHRGRHLAEAVVTRAAALTRWAAAVGRVDAITALAEVAVHHRLARPRWRADGFLVRGVRHPLVEQTVASYVPSDLDLRDPNRLAIITGPNMAGKSTFMRAVALNAWLQHVGSFVAAESWEGPRLDGIFTRMGADDQITRGQSTFMVEMEETALILRQAGRNALVLLDELGRGTSTFDGLAIAWAVTEHLADPEGPYTLFATHYRELSNVDRPGILRLAVDALVAEGRLVLLHEVRPGVASRSFGVAVAAQAGLPMAVLRRAERLLRQWERDGRPTPPRAVDQANWFDANPDERDVLQELRALDVDRLTPLQGLAAIQRWQERLRS